MKAIFSICIALFVVAGLTATIAPDTIGTPEFGLAAVSITAVSLVVPQIPGALLNTIGLEAARSAVTNAIVAIYNEKSTPASFLSSFFPWSFSPTKLVSIEVRRGTEKIAVDILRGTGTNLNKKSRSTIKTMEPPLYGEGFNVNELDVYDTAFGTLDPKIMAQLSTEAADTLNEIKNKILRAYEKQCADALNSGVITVSNGDNIDFKRKAASLQAYAAGTDWTDDTVDPMVALQTDAQWIRENGKSQGGIFNVIMGADVFSAMTNNAIFQAKYDLKDVQLGELREPQRMSTGGTLHGRVSAGSYKFNIWTYPEGYRDSADVFQKYIPDTDYIMVPENTEFRTQFALVPQLPGMTPLRQTDGGAFVFNEYIDVKGRNHVQEILSAGVALPLAIDTIVTRQITS